MGKGMAWRAEAGRRAAEEFVMKRGIDGMMNAPLPPEGASSRVEIAICGRQKEIYEDCRSPVRVCMRACMRAFYCGGVHRENLLCGGQAMTMGGIRRPFNA